MTNFNYVYLFTSQTDPQKIFIEWSAKDIGFGMVSVRTYQGNLIIDSELMDKEFMKELFCKLVDNAIIDA